MPNAKKSRTIYLLRHGHINNESCYIGQTDLPLSEAGIQQCYLLQKEFNEKKIAAIFCSDLGRSVATAKIIAADLPQKIIVRPSFREINLGSWEGKNIAAIKRDFPQEYKERGNNIAAYRISGGESFQECQARIVAAFLEMVNSSQGDFVIVGHAGANRALICHLLGMPLNNLFQISQDYACINILLCHNGHWHIKALNVQALLAADADI